MTALVPSSVKPDTKTDQDHPNQGGFHVQRINPIGDPDHETIALPSQLIQEKTMNGTTTRALLIYYFRLILLVMSEVVMHLLFCNFSCFTLCFTVYRLRKKVSREQIQEDARCLFSNIFEETQIFLFPRGRNLQQSNATWRYGGSHTSHDFQRNR